jgi:cytochrome c556
MAKLKIDSADLKKGMDTNTAANVKIAQDFADFKQAQADKADADAKVIADLTERLGKAETANEDYKTRIAELEDLTSEEVEA